MSAVSSGATLGVLTTPEQALCSGGYKDYPYEYKDSPLIFVGASVFRMVGFVHCFETEKEREVE